MECASKEAVLLLRLIIKPCLIMEGAKDILCKISSEKKADWMREAMLRMNKLLPLTIRKAVR